MRGARALAAMTIVLKYQLEAGLAQAQVAANLGGSAAVTALPPDRIATGEEERPQLNLFLYQVTPNLAWRRRDGDGGGTALDLHYLLTAYGAGDMQVELLLGCALEILRPIRSLEPGELQSILEEALRGEGAREIAPALTPLVEATAPVERVELSLQFLPLEELSRLWSAIQARYRPSAVFKVALVYV
jgi:hypothetical protein